MTDFSLVNDVAQLFFGRVCVFGVLPVVIVLIGAGVAQIMNLLTGHMIE